MKDPADPADIIRDAITFGMGCAYSEGAVDDHSERDEALAALTTLLAENEQLRMERDDFEQRLHAYKSGERG